MKICVNIVCVVSIIFLFQCGKEESVHEGLNCIPKDLRGKVLAFYPFYKGTLSDLSGNNYHLSNVTGARPGLDRNFMHNCAYEFDNWPNESEFLTRQNPTFFNGLNEFSISLWYQPKDTSMVDASVETLICRGEEVQCPDRRGQWSLSLYDCRKAVWAWKNSVWDKGFSGLNCRDEMLARTDNWAHVVVSVDQLNGIMKIYRNSMLQNVSSTVATCSGGPVTSEEIGNLFIGKNFTGMIDDIIIFKNVLSQADVNELYAMEACCD